MKLSDLSDQEWFTRLSGRRNSHLRGIRDSWAYYDGNQPLYHVAKILAEQDNRFPPLTVNWCRKYVRSIDGRSTLEGFGYVGEDSIDDTMQDIMRRNELDLRHSVNNVSTLVTGRSFGVVGPSDEGAVISIESPSSMAVETDPLTHEAVGSLQFWSSSVQTNIVDDFPYFDRGVDDRAFLQLPDPRGGSRVIEFENSRPVGEERNKWMAGPAKLQKSGLIPVVPFLNQPRYGIAVSVLDDLIPVVDAANFAATSMMATILRHAMPRILAINVESALFLNKDGSVNQAALKSATGSVWMVPAPEDEHGVVLPKDQVPQVDIKQLPASDLRNFHDTMNLLARIGAGLCDLVPSDFGFGVSDNPPSAESIEASKHERLLGIERFNRQQGAGYERLMRYALAVQGDDVGGRLIDAKFRNVATPTKQSMANAAVSTLSSGIADLYQARLDYGYTPTQIAAMEERERTLRQDPFLIADNAVTPAPTPAPTDGVVGGGVDPNASPVGG